MGKRVYYVDGVTPYVMRRILRLYFNGFFSRLILDQKAREFKIWMLNEYEGEKIDREAVKYFKETFFGCNFIIIDLEEAEII